MSGKLEKLFWYLFIFLLPSQTAKHFWPSFSFVNGLRVDYLSPAIYLNDLILIILLIFRPPRVSLPSKIRLPLIILVTLNIIFSISPLLSVLKIIHIFLYWCLYLRLRQEWPNLKTVFIKAFPIALLWTCFLALWQFAGQHSVGLFWSFLGERPFTAISLNVAKISLGDMGLVVRPYGTFPHPNALAGFLFVSFWLIVYYRQHLRFGYLLSGLIILTLFLTLSRSVTLIFSISLIIYSVVSKRYKQGIGLSIFLLIIFCFGLFYGAENSLTERVFLMQKSWFAFTKNYLVGIGLGTFPKLMYSISGSNPFIIYQPVHNIFLLVLSETGLLGFVALIAGLIKILKQINIHQNMPLFLAVAGVLLTGLVDHYWLTSSSNLYLLIFLLVMFKVNDTANNE